MAYVTYANLANVEIRSTDQLVHIHLPDAGTEPDAAASGG